MRCSKDVKLRAGNAAYHFKFLAWDTVFFGKDSFALDAERSCLKPSGAIKKLFKNKFKDSFITAKIDSGEDSSIIDFLQSVGFKYIDTEVALRYCGSKYKPKASTGIRIEEIKKNVDLPYAEIGSSFSYTRFHADNNVSRKKADLLWISCIKNFKPSAKDHMFVARLGKKVVGAILVSKSTKARRLYLCFVAVVKEFRGKNIGTELIQHVINRFKGFDIVTGTQAKNIKAMNFYINNGFSEITNTRTILHRWG